MMKNVFAVLGLSLVVAACSGGNAPAAKATVAPAAPPAATAAQAPAAAGEIGIPACDEYITKYSACLEKNVPEAARGALRQAFDQTKAAWKEQATTAAAKDALAMGCKQAHEASKAAVAAYGCTL